MSELRKRVLSIINDVSDDTDEKKTFMKDVLQHGCQSGVVGELIYYNDTVKFYEEFKDEIDQMLYEIMNETGLSVGELFGDKWDELDPLANDMYNKNLLAWFGFEEITRGIYEDAYGYF